MDREEATVLARKLMDERYGLGKDEAHQAIRTNADVYAVHKLALALATDLVMALHPFAKAADDIERDYGKDLPDHQIQFTEIDMGSYRTARRVTQPEGY